MAGRLKEKANVEIVMLMRMTRTLLGHRVFTNSIINDERIKYGSLAHAPDVAKVSCLGSGTFHRCSNHMRVQTSCLADWA